MGLTVAQLQTQLDAVYAAINAILANPAASVSYQGRTVQYQDLGTLQKLQASLESQIARRENGNISVAEF